MAQRIPRTGDSGDVDQAIRLKPNFAEAYNSRGVALAGVILTSLKGTEPRLREDMKQLSERVARVEHSQAKLEGLLEGLREAITVRASAS